MIKRFFENQLPKNQGARYTCFFKTMASESLQNSLSFRPSHRSLGEQIVGLGLFMILSLLILAGLVWTEPNPSSLIRFGWTLYHLFCPVAMWMVWRRFSMRTHKVEFTIFFLQFIFEIGWLLALFGPTNPLLAVTLLFLFFCNALLSSLFVWKKERIASGAFGALALWIFWNIALTLSL